LNNTLLILALAQLFVISFVSNATPFFGASYTLIGTSILIKFGFSLPLFLVVVLISGFAAAIAKLVIYYGALGFQKKLIHNKNILFLRAWLRRRSFYVALFVTALIPVLPLDDYLYIGAGANKAKLLPMIGITVFSKVLKSFAEIALEFAGIIKIAQFTSAFGLSAFEISVFASAFFVVLGIVLYKIDWEKALAKLRIIRARPQAR
jgi:hypothetical protein